MIGEINGDLLMESTEVSIGMSNIVKAFNTKSVGSRVKSHCANDFLLQVENAIRSFDWSSCRTPGQAYIMLDKVANEMVFAGIGVRTNKCSDYVVRAWRGNVSTYLRREHALKCDTVAVVVYTKEAYLKDPDVAGDPEKGIPRDEKEYERVLNSNNTHIIVAVLASSNAELNSPVSPGRFVANLAGGNLDYANLSGDEIRERARQIRDFYDKYCTVAD